MLYYTLRVMNESYPVTILTLMYVIWEAFKKHVKSFFEGFPNYNQINIVRNCQDSRNEILDFSVSPSPLGTDFDWVGAGPWGFGFWDGA